MSTVHESPVKFYPGNVTLPDYLDHAQTTAYRAASHAARAMPEDTPLIDFHHTLLPGLLVCVESWDIPKLRQPVTADNFPVTPPDSARKLTQWLLGIVSDLLHDAEDIPNA